MGGQTQIKVTHMFFQRISLYYKWDIFSNICKYFRIV